MKRLFIIIALGALIYFIGREVVEGILDYTD
jgi:hypothetical protein